MIRDIPLPRRRDADTSYGAHWAAKRAEAKREAGLVMQANGDWIESIADLLHHVRTARSDGAAGRNFTPPAHTPFRLHQAAVEDAYIAWSEGRASVNQGDAK